MTNTAVLKYKKYINYENIVQAERMIVSYETKEEIWLYEYETISVDIVVITITWGKRIVVSNINWYDELFIDAVRDIFQKDNKNIDHMNNNDIGVVFLKNGVVSIMEQTLFDIYK